MNYQILQGNVFDRIKEVADNSIDLCITSPPYWGLRDYGVEGQFGNEPTMEEYLEKSLTYIKEIFRVLKPSGSFVLNIGDCFKEQQLLSVSSFLYCKILQETDFVCRGEHLWLKPNVPSPIRSRLKHSHEKLFWFVKDADEYYFNQKAWMKKVEQSSIARNLRGVETKHEEAQGSFSQRELKEHGVEGRMISDDKETIEHSWRVVGDANKPVLFEYSRRINEPDTIEITTFLRKAKEKISLSNVELYSKTGEQSKFEHYFRIDASGCALPSVEDWLKLKEILKFDDTYDKVMLETETIANTTSREELKYAKNIGNNFVDGSGETIEHSYRIIPVGEKQKGFELYGKEKQEHVAPFPEGLIKPYLQSLVPENGVVLEPFLGSGTTMKIARDLHLNCIGIELNPKYIEYAKKRLNWENGVDDNNYG